MKTSQAPPTFKLPAALRVAGFGLRPESDSDVPFLMALYASTREQELAPLPWSAAMKQAFLASQFQAQCHHYHTQIGGCSFEILEHNGMAAGRLYLDIRQTRMHVVDIALMPQWRGRGVGGAIMTELQVFASSRGKGVGIFVEKFNQALRLYRRLGFTDIADHEVYLEMEWLPQNLEAVS